MDAFFEVWPPAKSSLAATERGLTIRAAEADLIDALAKMAAYARRLEQIWGLRPGDQVRYRPSGQVYEIAEFRVTASDGPSPQVMYMLHHKTGLIGSPHDVEVVQRQLPLEGGKND